MVYVHMINIISDAYNLHTALNECANRSKTPKLLCVCVCLAGTKCCYNIVESTNNDNNKNQQQHSKKCSLSAYICHNNTIHYKLICPESSNIPNIAE